VKSGRHERRVVMKGELLQFIRFLTFGAIAVGLNFAIYSSLIFMHSHYIVANCVAFVFGAVIEFYLNKRWVFRSQRVVESPSFKRFVIVNIFILLLSNVALAVVVESQALSRIFPSLSENAELIFAKIPVLFIVATVDYVCKKCWVFESPNNVQNIKSKVVESRTN